jgi:hypothetical protein
MMLLHELTHVLLVGADAGPRADIERAYDEADPVGCGAVARLWMASCPPAK